MLEFHGSPSRFAVNVFDHTSDTTCDFRLLSTHETDVSSVITPAQQLLLRF